jgi:hypothetical protein
MLSGMKTKNQRDLEKYWADQAKKAAKPPTPKPAKKKRHKEAKPAAGQSAEETAKS